MSLQSKGKNHCCSEQLNGLWYLQLAYTVECTGMLGREEKLLRHAYGLCCLKWGRGAVNV